MKTLDEVEKDHIEMVLKSTNFNKTKSAKLLKIALKTLYNKIKKYGLKNGKSE